MVREGTPSGDGAADPCTLRDLGVAGSGVMRFALALLRFALRVSLTRRRASAQRGLASRSWRRAARRGIGRRPWRRRVRALPGFCSASAGPVRARARGETALRARDRRGVVLPARPRGARACRAGCGRGGDLRGGVDRDVPALGAGRGWASGSPARGVGRRRGREFSSSPYGGGRPVLLGPMRSTSRVAAGAWATQAASRRGRRAENGDVAASMVMPRFLLVVSCSLSPSSAVPFVGARARRPCSDTPPNAEASGA